MEIKHIGFIMDGNRRFAKKNTYSKEKGYSFGLDKMVEFVKLQIKYNIHETSFWALSTENWKMRGDGLKPLKLVIDSFLKDNNKEEKFFLENKIKINLIGDIEEIKNSKQVKNIIIKKMIVNLENRVNEYNNKLGSEFNFKVNICINYGGHREILDSFKSIMKRIERGELRMEGVTEETIKDNIYFNDSPAPEIIVRPGDAPRLSGFMSWDSDYSEIYFTKKFWPELNENDFIEILNWFKNTKRNFGK